MSRLVRSRLIRQRTADRILLRLVLVGVRLRYLHGAALAGAAAARAIVRLTSSPRTALDEAPRRIGRF